jgi:hypothetical protein
LYKPSHCGPNLSFHPSLDEIPHTRQGCLGLPRPAVKMSLSLCCLNDRWVCLAAIAYMFFVDSSTFGSSKDTPASVSLGFLARIQLARTWEDWRLKFEIENKVNKRKRANTPANGPFSLLSLRCPVRARASPWRRQVGSSAQPHVVRTLGNTLVGMKTVGNGIYSVISFSFDCE